MSDEQQHMALPRLFGGPAYSRPPRPVQEIVRPFDPDELPLEADRTEIDHALASELAGATWSAPPAPPAKSRNADAGLQGRPFSLRGLGRIFGGDRK